MAFCLPVTSRVISRLPPAVFRLTASNRGYKYLGVYDIGNREIVGHGVAGQPFYMDRVDKPFPAIRFREPTPDIQAVLEKEKGDWKKLTLEEKKALYRYNYRQTFAEFLAPDGEWKMSLGMALLFISLGLWAFLLLKITVYPPLPLSASEENQRFVLRKMLDLKVDYVQGLSSKWDYEKDCWKK